MGAEYSETTIKAISEDDLLQKYKDYQEHMAYLRGHGGYSGTLYEKEAGLKIIPGTWTVEKAEEHCTVHNEKWGQAYAYLLEGEEKEYYIGGWCSS
jgi:hypothetical protein